MTTQRQVSAEAYPTRRTIREAERRAQIAAREHEQLYVEQPAAETTVKSPGSSAEKARAEAVVAGAPVVDQDRPLTRRERRRSRSIDERLSSESDTIQSTPRSMEPETTLAGPSIKSSEPSVKPAERPTTFVPVTQWATEKGQTPPTSRRSQRTHSSQGTHSAVLETKTTSKDASGRWMPRMAILGSLAAATTVIPLTGSPTSPATAGEVVHYEATDVLDVLMASSDYGTDVDAAVSLGADPLVGVRTAVSASRNSERTAPLCGNLAASANGSGAAEVASRPLEVVKVGS